MLVLGLETSCDETGVALYDSERGLLADALFSQIDLHRAYGGVVPELASRDHVKRMLPLIRQVLAEADARDVVLIAGKGHEDYQEIKGIKHHFDDKEVLHDIFNVEK